MSSAPYLVLTEALRDAAARYERPAFPSVLNDPYHGADDAYAANARFIQSLSRYASRRVAPILGAAQADVAWLQARTTACRAWALMFAFSALCAVVLFGFTNPLTALVALPSLTAAHRWELKCRKTRVELGEAEAFYAGLQGWLLQFKLASLGSEAVNEALAA